MRVGDRGGVLDAPTLPLADPAEVVRADPDLEREALCLLALSRTAAEGGSQATLDAGSPSVLMQRGEVARLLSALADEERHARVLEALDGEGRLALAPRLARVRQMATVVHALLSMRAEAMSVERAQRAVR